MNSKGVEPSIFVLLGAGMISSTIAMLCCYPIGLAKTRLQASGLPGKPIYSSISDVFARTIKTDGFRGLYRGIIPNLAKVLPASSISFAI